MPRQRSLVTVIRDMVGQEVRSAIQSLLGSISTGKRKAKNGRRRRRKARGKWRPGWSRSPAEGGCREDGAQEEGRGDARSPEDEDRSPPSQASAWSRSSTWVE